MIRIILLACLFFAQPIWANIFDNETTLSKISKDLPPLNNINCKFTQEKQISDMLIKSSGDFSFDKTKGVNFYTTYPIKSANSYTSAEYQRINSIIKAISNKSYTPIERDFRTYFEKNGEVWKLALIPKQNSQAYNYLKSIEIEGRVKIDKIVILTCDKTKTTIRFYD